MAVSAIPSGYHTITPFLVLENPKATIEFAKRVFGAEVKDFLEGPGGEVMHASIKIGDSMLMFGTAKGEWPAIPGMLHLYVPNCDELFQRAVDAGAEVVMPISDMFYGDRSGGVKDSQGNTWWLATHIEDVPFDEISRRAAAQYK